MHNVLVTDVANDHAGFRESHNGRIGGTRAAAICGYNDWCTPLDVFLEMTGKTEPFAGNDKTWLGEKFQPIIGELFTRRTGKEVRSINEVWQSETHLWMIATPDFQILDDENGLGLLEAKSQGHWAKDNWADDSAPDYAQAQLYWQMAIDPDISYGHVGGLIGGFDFFHPKYLRAQNAIEYMTKRCSDFLSEYVVPNVLPPVVAQDKETIAKHLGEAVKDFQIELDEESGRLIEKYDVAYAQYKESAGQTETIKEEVDAIKVELMTKMGQAAIGTYGDRTVKRSLRKVAPYMNKGSEYTVITVK